jgi:Central domain of human glycogen debranching enzyme
MVKNALLNVRKIMTQFGYRMRTFSYRRMSLISNSGLEDIITSLTLNDLNRLLFRCDSEEKDDLVGFGAYHLDNYGPLKYCGLQGV